MHTNERENEIKSRPQMYADSGSDSWCDALAINLHDLSELLMNLDLRATKVAHTNAQRYGGKHDRQGSHSQS